MENNNIQTKVNRIGKAGRIVSIILIVLLSMGALALVLGGIACAILPQDLVEVILRPVVDVKVDKELMGAEWANIDKLLSETQEKAGEEFEGAGVVLEKGDEGLLVHVDPKEEADATFGLRDANRAIWAGLVGIASAIVTLVMFLKLCQDIFDLAFDGAYEDLRLEESRRPYHLLYRLNALVRLIFCRGGADEDGLSHALFELIELEGAVIKCRRKTESVIYKHLLT